jgi:hypothetical protein
MPAEYEPDQQQTLIIQAADQVNALPQISVHRRAGGPVPAPVV